MWNYLKSDLQELVSVVKEDTNVVLEKIQDDQQVKKETAASREAERRMAMEETFTYPLLPDAEADYELEEEEVAAIQEFQKTFDLESKTDEISNLLEHYPDSVRPLFEELVPQTITYEDFWERFFFRCDESRIQAEWEEEEKRAKEARAELIGSVSNFLGGAAKAVASGVATVATAASNETGRPPFVMNTAVSEDEDDEEDEEELGWGDEDDLSDEEAETASGPVESVDDNTEQIEFKDEALEATKAELKQALEERDQLHQTVELQKKEISSLRSGTAPSEELQALKAEMEGLKATLAKKDQEIDALKASSSDDKEATLVRKIDQLILDLAARDETISSAEKKLAETKKSSTTQVEALNAENTALKEKLDKALTDASQQQGALEAESESLQNRVASLTAELKATKAQAKADTELLRKELETLRAGNEKESDATPESVVKLNKPSVSKLSLAADEEDDWGDDWD